jgi:hypothetical protein
MKDLQDRIARDIKELGEDEGNPELTPRAYQFEYDKTQKKYKVIPLNVKLDPEIRELWSGDAPDGERYCQRQDPRPLLETMREYCEIDGFDWDEIFGPSIAEWRRRPADDDVPEEDEIPPSRRDRTGAREEPRGRAREEEPRRASRTREEEPRRARSRDDDRDERPASRTRDDDREERSSRRGRDDERPASRARDDDDRAPRTSRRDRDEEPRSRRSRDDEAEEPRSRRSRDDDREAEEPRRSRAVRDDREDDREARRPSRDREERPASKRRSRDDEEAADDEPEPAAKKSPKKSRAKKSEPEPASDVLDDKCPECGADWPEQMTECPSCGAAAEPAAKGADPWDGDAPAPKTNDAGASKTPPPW